MKFSFNLIKKLAPGKYDKKALVERLNLMSFEAGDLAGDAVEVSVPPNRFSDAASHSGIAREASVIFDCALDNPLPVKLKPDFAKTGPVSVKVREKKLCRRYLGAYAENIKISPSPKWLKDVLETCGLRSINNVVDIMNYAMLETGQPLHAFDAAKLKGGITVRKAGKGEKIETIDNQKFTLDQDVLVIADAKQPLAIAGIKGGKSSEVSAETKRVFVEAANFDGTNIYQSSRRLGLKTDASVRFAHNLSPELAGLGMDRVLVLLKELAQAKIYSVQDFYPKKQSQEWLRLDLAKINQLIGRNFKETEAVKTLKKLGFRQEKKLWLAPALRTDISNLEDLAEELARFGDYNKLPAVPPAIALGTAEEAEEILLKDKARNFFQAAGFSEVYNYSLVSEKETGKAPAGIFGTAKPVALANPLSGQFAYLRDSLVSGLSRNLKENSRFYNEVRILEIGKIFGESRQGLKETLVLGAAILGKNGILELKGALDGLLGQLGLSEYLLPEFKTHSDFLKAGEILRIETDEHRVLGYLGVLRELKNAAVLEIDLEKLLKELDEEREFEPIAKYPAISRDISVLVSRSVRVGQILNLLYSVNSKLVEDVDLVDFYEDSKLGEGKKSLTFRIVFRADDHTLTDQEADREVAIVSQILAERFDAELR